MGEDSELTIWYMQQVVGWQPRLYAFVLSLTGNTGEADDILQNTNLVLLKSAKPFGPRPVSAHGRCKSAFRGSAFPGIERPSWGRFDSELVEQLAVKAGQSSGDPAAELRLAMVHRAFIVAGAQDVNASLRRQLGRRDRREMGRSVGSISQTLYRIRGKLAKCVKRALNAEQHDEL